MLISAQQWETASGKWTYNTCPYHTSVIILFYGRFSTGAILSNWNLNFDIAHELIQKGGKENLIIRLHDSQAITM